MSSRLLRGGVAAALAFAVVGLFSPAGADSHWAPAGEADIHPGVMTFTEGAQCTSNFVFTDSQQNVYIGQAAHCSGTGASADTNGCEAESHGINTEVEIDGATQPGTMVYNSWLTMQHVGEDDLDACNFNDFALVQLHEDDHDSVNPSIPIWGGPEGLNTTGTDFGDSVYSYGNSSLRLGISNLSPKEGVSLGTIASGWSHPLYTLTPGIPGDSGSAFLDADGNALGVLSTLAIAPLAGSNNVSDLGLALQYMRANADGFDDVQLVEGTEAFDSGALLTGLLSG